MNLCLLHWQADSVTTEPPGKKPSILGLNVFRLIGPFLQQYWNKNAVLFLIRMKTYRKRFYTLLLSVTTFNTPLLPPRHVGSRFLQGNLNIFLLGSVNNWCHRGVWDPRILLLPLAVICPLVCDFRIELVIPYPEKAACLRGNNECYKTQMLL